MNHRKFTIIKNMRARYLILGEPLVCREGHPEDLKVRVLKETDEADDEGLEEAYLVIIEALGGKVEVMSSDDYLMRQLKGNK